MEEIEVAVWGTGTYGESVWRYIEYANKHYPIRFKLRFFIDNDSCKIGNSFHGYRIISPDDCESVSDCNLIIAAAVYSAIQQEIDERTLVFKNVYIYTSENFRLEQILWPYLDEYWNDSNIKIDDYCFWHPVIVKSVYDIVKKRIKNEFYKKLIVTHRDWLETALMTVLGDDIESAEKCFEFSKGKNKYCGKIDSILIYYRRYYNGGVERVISEQLPMFLKMGLRVYLLTDVEVPDREYKLPDGVVRLHIDQAPMITDLWVKDVVSLVEKYNIKAVYYHVCNDPKLYYLCYELNKEGIYLLTHIHTNRFRLFTSNVKEIKYYTILYKHVDAVITLSHSDQEYLRERDINAFYLPNPIGRRYAKILDSERENSYNNNTILWLGRIDQKEKKVLDVPYIFNKVCSVISDAKLIIVGNADDPTVMDRLIKSIKKYGLEDKIRFEPFTVHPEDYYKLANLYFLTSQSEGFSLSVVECLSCGTPVVMYDLEYLEVVRNKGGILVAPIGDKDTLADQIVKILKDNQLRNRLSLEAKTNARKLMNVDFEKEWEKIFDSIHNKFCK